MAQGGAAPERTPYHQQLSEIFSNSSRDFISVFSRIITHSNELSIICRAMIMILSGTDSLISVLEWSLKNEFAEAESPLDLFRGGLHGILLAEYCKNFSNPYVEAMLGKCLREMNEQYKKRVLEVNPLHATDHIDNADRLRELSDIILNSISTTAELCPPEFRLLMICIANLSKEKFPSDSQHIVSTFFFQMFILPVIKDPEAYSLKEGHNLPRGTVIYLLKLLQHVAQHSTCSSYMAKFNDYIENAQPKILKFLSKLLKPPTVAVKTSVSVPTCSNDCSLLALNCLQYYIYWYLQDFTNHESKERDHPFSKIQTLMTEWELYDGKPDPIEEKDLKIDYTYQPKTARGTRQGFFKRKKTNLANNPNMHFTTNHQTHLQNLEEQAAASGAGKPVSVTNQNLKHKHQLIDVESQEDSEKISGDGSSSAAESEYSLSVSETEELRLQKMTENAGSPMVRPKKGRRSITTTTAQQIQEKKIAEFNTKLLRSLIYRQERDNQVRQSALRLKYNYFPSLDDDLWDWQRAVPSVRASFLRGVITRREYVPTVEAKRPKKLSKTDRRPSRNNVPKGVEISMKQSKRSARRSNTGDTKVARSKSASKTSPEKGETENCKVISEKEKEGVLKEGEEETTSRTETRSSFEDV